MRTLGLMSLICSLAFALSGCKPDRITIDLYTSDVSKAAGGEVISVPVTAEFSTLGEDNEGLIPKAAQVAEQYVSPETEFTQSKGDLGENLVVESLLPMGTEEALYSYLEDNTRIAVLLVVDDTKVFLTSTSVIRELDRRLRKIDITLGIDMPAKDTAFNVISDSDSPYEVKGTAVFVSGKPHLRFSERLEKRGKVEVVLSGEDGSVYRELTPFVQVIRHAESSNEE